MGQGNVSSSNTSVKDQGGDTTFTAQAQAGGTALEGDAANGIGVVGTSASGDGVHGNGGGSGTGVVGTGGSSGTGVFGQGQGSGRGVIGQGGSNGAAGVHGFGGPGAGTGVGDFCLGTITELKLDGGRQVYVASGESVPQLSSFGQDQQGELYALSLAGGIYKLQP